MVTIADASHANLASLILECTAIVLRSLTSFSLTDMRIHRLPGMLLAGPQVEARRGLSDREEPPPPLHDINSSAGKYW